MTMLHERPTSEITRMPERSRVTELVLGIAGLLAGAIGAWMYFVPADWLLGGLQEGWYLGMATGAGLLLAGAFGLMAREIRTGEPEWTTGAIVTTVLAVAALAAAVTFAIILAF